MLKIQGQKIHQRPLEDEDAYEYKKIATVFAQVAPERGVVYTPEGVMDFDKGDYIVTDNPVTHAWPVKKEVFERTYVVLEDWVVVEE